MTAPLGSDSSTPEPVTSGGDGEGDSLDSGGAPESGGKLRQRYEAALARIAELEGEKAAETGDLAERLMAQEYERLGLDPETGMGKAIAVTYDGEPEGLAEYAQEEFGYTPLNPLVPKIANSYAALDGIAAAAGSITPPSGAQELAKAEARGDTDTTLAMKSGQLGQMLRSR